MLFGLTLGLVVAVGRLFPQRLRPPRRRPRSSPAAAPEAGPAPSTSPDARGAQNTRAPRAREASEPRFDFYEILPQFEVVVPEVDNGREPGRALATCRSRSRAAYVLQAGSFSALGDADRLKAKIALLGVESQIQRVTIDDDVFHRVRIGPISDFDRLNRIRRQLRDAQVDTLLMKIPQ